MRHPIQPLEKDEYGVIRFKRNKIICYLFESGKIDLNQIACMNWSNEERQQLAQLLGYSLSGYGELSYVDDIAYEMAEKTYNNKDEFEKDIRIKYLEERLESIKNEMKSIVTKLYEIHPDDLR